MTIKTITADADYKQILFSSESFEESFAFIFTRRESPAESGTLVNFSY